MYKLEPDNRPLKQAYDAGATAFDREGRDALNPYLTGAQAFLYWDHGFRDAQKASTSAH